MGSMGLGDMSQTLWGTVMGQLSRAQVMNSTEPTMRRLQNMATPGQIANRNMTGSFNPNQIEGIEGAVESGFFGPKSFDQNMSDEDSGGQDYTYHYNTYGVPEGRADDIVSGYLQRLAAEKKKQHDMTAQRDEAEKQFQAGLGDFDTALSGLETGNKANYDEQQAIYREGVTTLQQQVTEFKATADQIKADLYALRGEALASAADRSAQATESVTQGIQMQTQAQEAEIDADPNLTAGQKSAAKARLRFVNGSELRMAAAKSINDELSRLDSVRAEHDSQIANALSTLGASEAGLRGNVSQGIAEMNKAFANNIANYRSTAVQMQANLNQAKAAFRMAGRTDLFNMTQAIPEAYFDSGELSALLLSEALMINQQDFDRGLETMNAQLAREGLGLQASQPYQLQGQASDNARYNELEAIKAKRVPFGQQVGSSFSNALASKLGGGIGENLSGGSLFGGTQTPSAPGPY